MIPRRLVRTLFALAALFGGIGVAHAREPIERSGNVYHEAVCSHAISRGQARCFAHIVVDADGRPIIGRPQKPSKGGPPTAPSVSYTAAQLQAAYGIPSSGTHGIVAIVDAYGYPAAEADLATYRSTNGLPPCPTSNGCLTIVNQTGGSSLPGYNRSWAQEQALDLDMVSAACPDCSILLVQADSNQFSDLAAAANTAANTSGVIAVSNSYGGGENGSQAYAAAYDHPGKAVTVSAGDNGYGVQFPASAPTVVAVGGTTLTEKSNGSWSETAWSGTGSGCSSIYDASQYGTWQNTSDNPTCYPNRMETDVSAVADPSTGVSVYGPSPLGNGSTWLTFGGTSVGAPLIAGIYGSVGIPSATAYPAQLLWEPAGRADLNDVQSGSNASGKHHSSGCSPSYYCTAGIGYDGPTGNGTPNGPGAF